MTNSKPADHTSRGRRYLLALQFTHAADFMARIVIRNTLFFGRSKASALTIPWCT